MTAASMTTSSGGAPVGEAAVGEARKLVTITVNGVQRSAEVEVRRTLADFLRHELALTGTHVGCEHGVCGACTVLLDGLSVRSCLLFAVTAHGHAVTTVEGLAEMRPDGTTKLSPVQQAFRDTHALQCGFCTPGFLTAITAGLEANPHPTPEQAVEMISGNLCRCTGYQNITEAVLRAAQLMDDPDAPLPDEGFTADHESGDAAGRATGSTDGSAKRVANGAAKDAANGAAKDAANGAAKDAANGAAKGDEK